MTVNKVVVDMSTNGAPQNRNALYVDISRAKYEAVVYTDNKKKLERETKNFVKKVTGKDFSQKISSLRQMQSKDIAEKYRYKAIDTSRQEAMAATMDRFIKNFLEPNNEIMNEIHLAAEKQKIARLENKKKVHFIERQVPNTESNEHSRDYVLSM